MNSNTNNIFGSPGNLNNLMKTPQSLMRSSNKRPFSQAAGSSTLIDLDDGPTLTGKNTDGNAQQQPQASPYFMGNCPLPKKPLGFPLINHQQVNTAETTFPVDNRSVAASPKPIFPSAPLSETREETASSPAGSALSNTNDNFTSSKEAEEENNFVSESQQQSPQDDDNGSMVSNVGIFEEQIQEIMIQIGEAQAKEMDQQVAYAKLFREKVMNYYFINSIIVILIRTNNKSFYRLRIPLITWKITFNLVIEALTTYWLT